MQSEGRRILSAVCQRATGRIGLVAVLLVALAALGAPLLASHMPNALDVPNRLTGPSAGHWLGTDHLGRDLYSRVLHGAQVAAALGLGVTLLAMAIGVVLGVLAALSHPWVERAILVGFDIVASFPSLVLALALVAVLGRGLENIVALITLVFVPHFGRLARAQALVLKDQAFIDAERLLGASSARIVLRHIVPNVIGPIVVLASMDIPAVITLEAGLSFLGVGVRPPLASWGGMLQDGYTYIDQSAWPILVASGALIVATLGFTLLGEALRDAIDPRLARGR